MAASAKTLGDLHEKVAVAFAEQVEGFVETDAEGQERTVRPSPALLGAAVAFLKNNNITADPETNAALGELKDKLAARRKGKVSAELLDRAANDFAAHMGGGMVQ